MQNRQFRLNGWRLTVLLLLLLGILFRFTHLGQKVYWHDEVFTSLDVSGYSRSELVQRLFVGRTVSVAELQAYQRINPERGIATVINVLAKEDPQHPPLYLTMLRLWLQQVGQSITTTRALSAVISLLSFLCLYWLCWELTQSALMGWVAIALLSVSPFNVLFAQEAREYSLWIVTTLFCSAALLRAMRLQTRRSWLLYTVSLTTSLYVFLFSGLVAIGHGVYVLAMSESQRSPTQKLQLDKQAIAFLISALYAVLAFAPWILAVVAHLESITSGTTWANQSLPITVALRVWLLNFSRVFVDFNPYIDDPAAYLLIVPVLGLEIVALYSICRHAPKRIWLFILTLMGSVALPIALLDLIFGGQRAIATRYLVPLELGLLLLVAYYLSIQIHALNHFRRWFARVSLALLILVGTLSCAVSSQSQGWWNKGINYFYPQMAETINHSGDRPVIISDAFERNPGDVIALSYLLDQKVKFILLPEITDATEVPDLKQSVQSSSLFFLGLPDSFLQKWSKKYQVNIVPVASELERVQP